jgi:TRAP-type C4-dicarboxylate transport system substrate-binding protein
MMRINVAPLNGVVPETIVTGLPFVFRSTEHMRKVLDGPVGDDILASMESQGLVGLAFYDSGRALVLFEEADPQRRGPEGPEDPRDPVRPLRRHGGGPRRESHADALRRGVHGAEDGIVDAAENNWPSYESSRHFEAAKFYTLDEHSLAPEVLVFSKVVWDKLSKEDQAAIRKAGEGFVPYMRKLWDEREVKSRKAVEAAGTQVITVANKQEFIDAMKPVYAKFANTPRLANLVKRIQDTK